jgi:hypothetical protein
MSTNPPSFRLPFALKDTFSDDVHPEVQEAIRNINHAIRYSFNGVTDLQSAIPVLKASIPEASTAGATGAATGNVIGATNDQTGQTAYTVQNSDYGALVVVNHGGGVAVGLNALVKRPYYSRIKVDSGSGSATFTPTQGTINGAGFIVVAPGTTVQVNLNSGDTNWTAS